MVNASTMRDIEAARDALQQEHAALKADYEARMATLMRKINALTEVLELFAAEGADDATGVPEGQTPLPFVADVSPSPAVDARAGNAQADAPLPERHPLSVHTWARKLRGTTHLEAMIRMARENEGIVRIPDAKRILVDAGMAKGNTKNVGPHLYHVLADSGRFERIAPGTFRLLPEGRSTAVTVTHDVDILRQDDALSAAPF